MMAQAHCIGRLGQFGISTINLVSTSAFQYDAYTTICPAPSQSIRARIALRSRTIAANPDGIFLELNQHQSNDPAPAHVLVGDATANAVSQCDGVGNESIGIGASGFISMNHSSLTPREYILHVSKDSVAGMDYAVEFHCHAGLNGTGAEIEPQQPANPFLTGANRPFTH
ncbi:MAG: hypothetical protein HOO93_15980 [Methyloglobulus sp.]|nr:hypothetical protein [Methyloglobulus sp.]